MITEKTELLQVKSDRLFHDLINENEMDTIEWIVMQILECPYEEIHGNVSVNNIRLTRVNKHERNKYVDLIVTYKNEKCIIELNNNFNSIYVRNFLFAANQLLNNYKLETSDYYTNITRVILVNLNWYPGNKRLKIEGKKIYEIPYSDIDEDGYLFKMINVNLDYYKNLCYDKVDIRDKLYKLLTIKDKKELNYLTKNEKLLNKYSKKLIDLSKKDEYVEEIMSEEIEEFLEKHMAYRGGLNDGIEQGIEKGIEKTQQEIVLNMHNENYKLEDISKITKLTIEEIENIIKNNK